MPEQKCGYPAGVGKTPTPLVSEVLSRGGNGGVFPSVGIVRVEEK